MKSRRRVEIRVERQELSIYASAAGSPVAAGQSRLGSIQPQSCPTCGSQQMLPLTEVIAAAESLKDGLESGLYHLTCSASGEWWVCGQSPRPGSPRPG